MCKLISVKTNFGTQVEVADLKKEYIENVIDAARDCNKIDSIILFGSSLEERCRKDSDIDLAIISNVTRSRLFKNKSYDRFTTRLYQSSPGQDYDLLQFNSKRAIEDCREFVCSEILKKGKTIYRKEGAGNV